MISQLSSTVIRNAYQTNETKGSESKAKVTQERSNDGAKVTKQGDLSKVDEIRSSIESGEYKVNLDALAEKIADQLM